MNLKAWRVEYKGLALGGVAIVLATSAERARELVAAHKDTPPDRERMWRGFEVKEIGPVEGEGVLDNWDGDY